MFGKELFEMEFVGSSWCIVCYDLEAYCAISIRHKVRLLDVSSKYSTICRARTTHPSLYECIKNRNYMVGKKSGDKIYSMCEQYNANSGKSVKGTAAA